jgi:hypothetical protein
LHQHFVLGEEAMEPRSKSGDLNSLRKLVREAFTQAEAKKGRPVRAMNLSVLNNRLLQMTERNFRPIDYGARTLRDLLENLKPDIALTPGQNDIVVELRDTASSPTVQRVAETATPSAVRTKIDAVIADISPEPEGEPDDIASLDTELGDAVAVARDSGDFFGVGELFARSLATPKPKLAVELASSRIIAAWAASKPPLVEPNSIWELTEHLASFSTDNMTIALVNTLYRLRKSSQEIPAGLSDLAYKLRDNVALAYEIDEKRSAMDMCISAVAELEARITQFEAAVQSFLRTTAVTAKAASIEVLRLTHALYPLLVPTERSFLRDLEVLIGPAFRKFCEAYERNDDLQVLRRGPEFLNNVNSHMAVANDPRMNSAIWNANVAPIIAHLLKLVEAAMFRGEVALAPALALRNRATKADLRYPNRDIFLTFALRNLGQGHANEVSLQSPTNEVSASLHLVEPAGAFDVPPGGEQLIRLRLTLSSETDALSLPVRWTCRTPLGRSAAFDDEISVEQQVTAPNWDALISDPPYSLNPIWRPDRLYGRDSVLLSLTLAAMSGASKFVWGQKRIGKTSLLQVLSANLSKRGDTTCILFKMGELAPLHEGQIARLIAQRLVEGTAAGLGVPAEGEFGASLGRLIPFVDRLRSVQPARKFVVIIDEFDDLDPMFYIGERGKQFIKALRSVSETGLTFFFIGSERMEAIYQRHQADLNKWTNIQLDRIDSRTECKALIVSPVADAIEFSQEAIDFIIDYCNGNPFYINNFCYQVFERCLHEHRTFVDDTDTEAVRHHLLPALGQTNFSHFWEDNPLLDQEDRRRAAAENCIALTCIAVLGGRYEDLEDLVEVQQSLTISAADRATMAELRRACERLIARRILVATLDAGVVHIALRIFREWLVENAVSKVLPIWTGYRDLSRSAAAPTETAAEPEATIDFSGFIIPEDDIIAVSQRLVFCGRQKDAAEIRSWLRQFDDEARIEVAFWLLKRLAERGFINEGARSLALARLEEMVRARRIEVGAKSWKVERGRLDNLCLTYVDSELKSGAATTRELRNLMRPGKSGPVNEVTEWMRTHLKDDPMVVVVDDFAGTGQTLVKGLRRFRGQCDAKLWRDYFQSGRLSVFLMFAFPEALDLVRKEFQGIHMVTANICGDELRACVDESGIFDDANDLRFARDVLIQIGRELYPSAPLGRGDIGALVAFHNAVPNNTLPIFWSNGRVGQRDWKPIFPRA